MVRIGILGSDNSHAMRFAELINFKDEKNGEYRFTDYRVTHIFGLDDKRTKEVAEVGKIGTIVNDPDEMMGNVDVIMVVFRHGDLHAKYALPFIEKGVPTWIDKPFTIKIDEAKKLIEAARKNNTILSGGTTNKHLPRLAEIKKEMKEESFGGVVSGAVTFKYIFRPQYGGLFFYGQHTVEVALSLFGYDVRSVYASKKEKNIIAVVKYDTCQIILNFMTDNSKLHVVVYGNNDFINSTIDNSKTYLCGFTSFVNALENKKSDVTYEQLLVPVVVLDAIKQSLDKGKEVKISDLI